MKYFLKNNTAKLLFGLVIMALPVYVFAQSGTSFPGPGPSGTSQSNTVMLVNPLVVGSICGLLKEILDVVLAFGVPIATLFLAYSGFLFVQARGAPKELLKAKRNFKFVILGILLFLGAWMLGQIIANTINSLTTGTGNPAVGSCR